MPASRSGKFGPHSSVVEGFLLSAGSASPAQWRALYDLATPTRETLAAGAALGRVRLSASVDSALETAARTVFRSVGLRVEDFPPFGGISRVVTSLINAVAVLAAGDQLAAEHRETILGPFARAKIYVSE